MHGRTFSNLFRQVYHCFHYSNLIIILLHATLTAILTNYFLSAFDFEGTGTLSRGRAVRASKRQTSSQQPTRFARFLPRARFLRIYFRCSIAPKAEIQHWSNFSDFSPHQQEPSGPSRALVEGVKPLGRRSSPSILNPREFFCLSFFVVSGRIFFFAFVCCLRVWAHTSHFEEVFLNFSFEKVAQVSCFHRKFG